MQQDARSAALIGQEQLQTLSHARVALFGLGGVGGFAAEALVRSGIGELALIDHDTVSLSNMNRQILASHDTLGMPKVEVAQARLKAIRPTVLLHLYNLFFTADTPFDFAAYDYIVDAVDTVSTKIALIERAQNAHTPIISCMGTGNKLDPTRLEVADLAQTTVCPLARVMRHEARKRGIEHVKVVYSREELVTVVCDDAHGRHAPGSMIFVPATAGLLLAREVVKDLSMKTVR